MTALSDLAPASSRYRGDPTRRSFTVDQPKTFPGDMHAHVPFRVRLYGHGDWTICHGDPRRVRTQAEAMALGERWNSEGRA